VKFRYLKASYTLTLSAFILSGCGKDSNAEQNGQGLQGEIPRAVPVHPQGNLDIPRAIPVDEANEEIVAQTMIGRRSNPVTGVSTEWNQKGLHGIYDPASRDRMTEFSKSHLREAFQNTQTIYYPFGGPDVIYPLLFFPKASTLILIGAEKIGALPTLEEASTSSFQEDIKNMMRKYLRSSFYVTTEMKSQTSEASKSTWTKMAASLALMNYTILSSELGSLDENGAWMGLSAGTAVSDKSPAGLRFLCHRYNANGRVDLVTIYYFRQNLGEYLHEGLTPLAKSDSFLKFMKIFNGNYTSFLKAASFLSHSRKDFKTSTELVFNAKYILQSESGVPFADFIDRQNNWKLKLFGNYDGPNLELFGGRYQKSLEEAYSDFSQKKRGEYSRFTEYGGALPFHYDYGDGPEGKSAGSTLMYGIRK